MSEVTTPMDRPTPTAIGRLRNLAAMTAAKAAAMSRVKLLASRPMMGAASTPANPAKNVLTAQTTMDTPLGLVPDRAVMAGESTMARTLSPRSVYRRIAEPRTTVPRTQPYTMIWSIVTATPKKLKTLTGSGARPGADMMAWLPKINVATAGRATRRPSVATTLISGEERRRCRKSAK